MKSIVTLFHDGLDPRMNYMVQALAHICVSFLGPSYQLFVAVPCLTEASRINQVSSWHTKPVSCNTALLQALDAFCSCLVGYKSRYRHFVAVPSLTETSSINQIQYPVIIQFKEHITPIAVHFWAPTFKWRVSIANVADFAKPPEKISYPQQIAATCTGLVWSRYSTVINPKNWNLFSVNIALSGTGLYQLSRKNKKDYFSEGEVAAMAKE
ncbi:Mitochondrial pyruvate carrier - like 5 [Theobroma cacao]|nr:Mitochondrial pyruvate carrier - like 5 [Theobroma cacao]